MERTEKHEELLRHYNKIDIALDISLQWSHNELRSNVDGSSSNNKKRDCFLSSVGETISKNSGQEQFCGRTEEDYVDKAVRVGKDVKQLNESRLKRRKKILESTIFDGEAFAKDFEKLLKKVVAQ